MSPREPSESAVELRLRLMRGLLGDLTTIGTPTAQELAADRITRLALERILSQLVDLAADINHKIVVSLGETPPEDQRDSFRRAGLHGLIPIELGRKLEATVGLRNIVNLEIDLDRIASSIALATATYGEYVRAIDDWIADPANPNP